MSEIKNIRDQFVSKLENDLSIDQINEIKTDLFGKNGLISSKFKTIGSISESDRKKFASDLNPVSYTHLRAHETDSYLVCRLLLEKKKN